MSFAVALEVLFEEVKASHRLISDRHLLRNAHLVEDDAGVDVEAGVALVALRQSRLVKAGRDDRGDKTRGHDAALVAKISVTRWRENTLKEDALRDAGFALERRRDEYLHRVHFDDLFELLLKAADIRTEGRKTERLDEVLVVRGLLQEYLEGLIQSLALRLGDEVGDFEAALDLGREKALVAADVQLGSGEFKFG